MNETSSAKRSYSMPTLKVYGSVAQLTHGIKYLCETSDGNYLQSKLQPLDGSAVCTIE